MRSLVVEEPGQPEWRERPDPERRHEREALVRPLAVAACDLDLPMVYGVPHFPLPIDLGHECVAEIVEGPEQFSAGSRVVVPFQISCGTCERCRRGLTGNCQTVPHRSMYGFGSFGSDWGGMLSDLALVPYAEAMLVPLPEGIDPAVVASAADNMPDGWRTVAGPLAELPAAKILIVGGAGRSIALYAVDAALALGAGSVTYVDTDRERLGIAKTLGAEVVEGTPDQSLGLFPITVDATATVEGLVATLRLTEPGGHCTSIGQVADEGLLPIFELYSQDIRLCLGPGMARPAIPAILDLVAAGRLRPELITTSIVDWEEAPQAMRQPATKLVMRRS
jgi:threonine dehydrogenase-like Zn-dependent dehydrogenase